MSNKSEAAKLIDQAFRLLPLHEQQGANGRAVKQVLRSLKAQESEPKYAFNPMDGTIGEPKSLQYDPATGQMAYLSTKEATSILSRLDRAIAAQQKAIAKNTPTTSDTQVMTENDGPKL